MAGNELKRAGNGMEELHARMLGHLAASLEWNGHLQLITGLVAHEMT